MGEGRESLPEGGCRAHEALVERIVAGPAGASREERVEATVEALAELLERDAARTPRLLAELLEDDSAQERIAARLGCPATQIPALLGGAAVALYREPSSTDRRDQVSSAVILLLLDDCRHASNSAASKAKPPLEANRSFCSTLKLLRRPMRTGRAWSKSESVRRRSS